MLWMTAALAGGAFGVDCPAREVAVEGLEGVRVRFPSQPCTFHLDRKPTPIRWEIVVDEPTGELIHRGERCYQVDATGFVVIQRVTQGRRSYEPWDHGKCSSPAEQPATPEVGVHAGSFTWSPHDWSGPSCTDQPLGRSFDAGDVEFTLSFSGTRRGEPFSVQAVWPMEVR